MGDYDQQGGEDWLFSEPEGDNASQLGIDRRTAGAGAYLAMARRKQKIDIEKIAAALRLTVQQVETLERDEVEAFSGEAFVRGYYRLYAKIVGVNQSEVAALLDKKIESDSARSPMHHIINRNPYQKQSVSWKMPFALVGVGIFALGLTLWGNYTGNNYSIDNLKALFDKETLAETVALDSSELLKNNLTSVPDITTSENSEQINNELAIKERLYLTIKEASWVSIKDAKDTRLLYQWVEKGQEIELFGFPPFKVFVGNAKGVSVEYKGRMVPIKADGSNLYSRLTIGVPDGKDS